MKKEVFYFKKGQQVSSDTIGSIQSILPFDYDRPCICEKGEICHCDDVGQDSAYAKENFKVIVQTWRRLK